MFSTYKSSFIKIEHYFTELSPLKKCHKFELLPFPRKRPQLSPLICNNWIYDKEQKLLCIHLSINMPSLKWIDWSSSELLPFGEILPFSFCYGKSNIYAETKVPIKYNIETWNLVPVSLWGSIIIKTCWPRKFFKMAPKPRWPP